MPCISRVVSQLRSVMLAAPFTLASRTRFNSTSQPRRQSTPQAATAAAALLLLVAMLPTSPAHRRMLLPSATPQPSNTSDPPQLPCSPSANSTLHCDFQGRPRLVTASSRTGLVATDHGTCSHLASQALAEGGHAVDAAVVAALCLGVVSAFSSGLGGGDFWLIRQANGSALFINARETAPAAASDRMFDGKPANASTAGGLAVAVPLQLKGLEEAWRRYGRRPWATLVEPAVHLAAEGFPMHPYLQARLGVELSRFILSLSRNHSLLSPLIRSTYFLQHPQGHWRLPHVGEHCCRQPLLAATLRGIARQGAAYLYSPELSETLAGEVRQAGGVMTAQDLQGSWPQLSQPLTTQVGDYTLLYPPPPSSAAALVLGLRMLIRLHNSTSSGGLSEAEQAQQLVEVMKHMFAVRTSLGDPGAPSAPFSNFTALLQDLNSPAFAFSLADSIQTMGVQPRDEYGGRWNPYKRQALAFANDKGTSHTSILDAEGNAVSLTMTINWPFGSGLISKSTGIVLNNQMGDFAIPGRGGVPSDHRGPNSIAPGKRPLSSMSPMILMKAGKPLFIIGASGGTYITSALLQVLQRLLLQQWAPLAAVTAPRLHHGFHPDQVLYENFTIERNTWRVDKDVLAYLKAQGQATAQMPTNLGVCQLVWVDPETGVRVAVSDPRKGGAPAVQGHAL